MSSLRLRVRPSIGHQIKVRMEAEAATFSHPSEEETDLSKQPKTLETAGTSHIQDFLFPYGSSACCNGYSLKIFKFYMSEYLSACMYVHCMGAWCGGQEGASDSPEMEIHKTSDSKGTESGSSARAAAETLDG